MSDSAAIYAAMVVCAAAFIFLLALAAFWGREVGPFGYWYWGAASLAPLAAVVFLGWQVAL